MTAKIDSATGLPLIKVMTLGGKDIEVPVSGFADGYPRGEDGTCAFCHGDPCNERPVEGSNIAKFYEENPHAATCPVCDGRPT